MTNNRFSDEDLERLVVGGDPDNQELSRLAEALQNWQADFTRTPSEEQVAAFASQAAEITAQVKPEATPHTTTAPSRNRLRTLKYKLAGGMAAVLMLSGMTGVAVASDQAAPGDALYGVDRALESVGLGDGGVLERFEEAQVLNERGNAGEALSHAAEAIAQAGGAEKDIEQALAGLSEAVAALDEEIPGEEGEVVRARVADMLGWMQSDGAALLSDPEAEPGAFGRAVAEHARGISPKADPADAAENAQDKGNKGANENAGPPDDVPGGPPADTRSNRP